jgi:hypothetical protein
MRRIVAIACSLLMCAGAAHADAPKAPFDGEWSTVVTCAPAVGALPYTYHFTSTVKDNVLHGERGVKGAPGWLSLDGQIMPDGSADIRARGLVGKARYAVGERPPGTPYSYHIDARFAPTSATGQRVKERSCTATFTRLAP